MDYQSWSSLTALFYHRAKEHAAEPFLWAKKEGVYRPLTWTEVERQIRLLSRGLRALGVRPGDRVILVAENRPEWFIADLAIMSAGAITVPAYTTNNEHDHGHLMNHSAAVGVIVSNRALAQRLMPAARYAADCRFVVHIEPIGIGQAERLSLISWDEAMQKGETAEDQVDAIVGAARRDDTACFIYTSGTGGTPKGVMLSHGNILCNCMGAYHLLKEFGLGHETFLSFLPLSHSYEHTAGQFFPMSIGAQIYYAEGVENLLNNLAEARPTIMTAVPRLYEAMLQRIMRGVNKQGGRKKRLFERTLELGIKRYRNPRSLMLGERITDFFLERLVRNKVRQRFGGRLKAFVSGGAALNPDVGIFFTALGLRVLQGYGQTEASPVISANPPGRVKMHTVGPPLRGVEVKIADDGEILVRGELVMKGYWRDEENTQAAISNGWLHTGDIGYLDEEGYLLITDRKKDIIVFSGGDNVSPARVEGFLTLQDEISQAMVYGDKRPNLVALIVPDQEFLIEWARSHGKSGKLSELSEDPDLRKVIAKAVESANATLSPLEKVRRFILAKEPFSVENELMTPTLKIKRHKIKEIYGPALDALYDRKG